MFCRFSHKTKKVEKVDNWRCGFHIVFDPKMTEMFKILTNLYKTSKNHQTSVSQLLIDHSKNRKEIIYNDEAFTHQVAYTYLQR